jgi:hypothetical protein
VRRRPRTSDPSAPRSNESPGEPGIQAPPTETPARRPDPDRP